MECACVDVDLCGDTMEMIEETEPIAATQHICCECKRVIEIGEKYRKEKGGYEEEIRTFKTCLDCLSIRQTFFCCDWYYEMIFKFLTEHIRELDGSVSEDCLIDLTPRARDKVCEIIEKCWGRQNDDEHY